MKSWVLDWLRVCLVAWYWRTSAVWCVCVCVCMCACVVDDVVERSFHVHVWQRAWEQTTLAAAAVRASSSTPSTDVLTAISSRLRRTGHRLATLTTATTRMYRSRHKLRVFSYVYPCKTDRLQHYTRLEILKTVSCWPRLYLVSTATATDRYFNNFLKSPRIISTSWQSVQYTPSGSRLAGNNPTTKN